MGTKIYVGNLGPNADKLSLKALFSIFGIVKKAYIVTDRDTGESKGFGFVEMTSEEEVLAAVKALNGKDCGGYTVKVSQANDKPKK
jgi:RNA recognition motif-containing protein